MSPIKFTHQPIIDVSNVRPFIIDLESTNGTIVNDETIPAARYYELKVGDSELPLHSRGRCLTIV